MVYDMAPLVRDLIRRQFRRENIKGYTFSPYGLTLTTKLDNTYTLEHYVLWARAERSLVKTILEQNAVALLPSRKVTYNRDAPQMLFSLFAQEEEDNSIYIKNKAGKEFGVFDYVINSAYNWDVPFMERYTEIQLPEGDYQVFIGERPQRFLFDLTVTDGCFPTEALKDGTMVYIRFCNQWGGISYALLQCPQRSKKNKNTYVQKQYALDGNPDSETLYTVYPDRVMTGQEITPSFKAGKDKLTSDELRELQAILVSPMVDRYDAEANEWVPVYPSDSTVTETNDALHEITIDFDENTEGF
ncbi:MAG: hypothetical protein HDT28_05015 [Clostridiales bacterium]|nr:hypothetical protein [Clostridiales bacterium]